MYKRRYTSSKLGGAIKQFNEEEHEKEDLNLHALEDEVKKIVKMDKPTPMQKLNKKIQKESKSKPIDTRVLLAGFL